MRIEGVDFQMEVDTGTAASIMSYTDYAPYFEYLALRPVNKSFHAYTGTPLDIAGQILVDVEYNALIATSFPSRQHLRIHFTNCWTTNHGSDLLVIRWICWKNYL